MIWKGKQTKMRNSKKCNQEEEKFRNNWRYYSTLTFSKVNKIFIKNNKTILEIVPIYISIEHSSGRTVPFTFCCCFFSLSLQKTFYFAVSPLQIFQYLGKNYKDRLEEINFLKTFFFVCQNRGWSNFRNISTDIGT